MAEYGPLTDQILGGKYQLGELLGQGGFGAVYKAQNLRLGRPQAIKVIVEQHLKDPVFRQRFDREAQTLGALDHPNILHVDDYEIENDRAYLVMPYIDGGTFRDVLKRQEPLSLEQAGDYLRQISAALDYAHSHKVVHLDLKPLNLLHRNGTLYLSDFGLAHLMNEGAVAGGSSLRFGTPHYMAPEHLKGQPERASDIYALGVILFQMLAGRVPFDGPNGHVIMYLHLQEPPPSLSKFRPGMVQAVDTVIQRAMAKHPEDRYPSAGRLFNDFKIKATLSVPVLPVTRFVQEHQLGSWPSVPSPALASSPPMGISRASSMPQFSGSFLQHSQVKLDTPPSLNVINHIVREVGKSVKTRNGGE